MKHLVAWGVGAAGVLVVVGLGSVPLGCVANNSGSPSDDGGPPLSEDSGTPPGQDATVPPVDSGGSDAGVNASDSSVDAGPQPVTVNVLLAGAPESGVLVVFQDASGAVVTTATTGATGSVSQLVVAGSR